MAKLSPYCLDCGGPCRFTHSSIKGRAPQQSYHSMGFSGLAVRGAVLTDKRINQLKAQGWYADGFMQRARAVVKKKQKRRPASIGDLLKGLI